MSNLTRRVLPRFVVAFGAPLLPALLLMVALLVIWPGHLKFWGYLDFVCPPPYNDPRVVVDTHHIAPGETSWTHDLLCLSDTGAIYHAGTGWL